MSILYHGTNRPKGEGVELLLKPHFRRALGGERDHFVFATNRLELAHLHAVKIREFAVADAFIKGFTGRIKPFHVIKDREGYLETLEQTSSYIISVLHSDFMQSDTAKRNSIEYRRKEAIDVEPENIVQTNGLIESMQRGVQILFLRNDVDPGEFRSECLGAIDKDLFLKINVANGKLRSENKTRGINATLG